MRVTVSPPGPPGPVGLRGAKSSVPPEAESSVLAIERPRPEPSTFWCRGLRQKRSPIRSSSSSVSPGPASVTATATAVAVAVTDAGPGLTEEELERIGDRFWRSPLHQNVDGSGLGLSIARTLLSASGGTLDFAPRNPTGPGGPGGLTVTLTVPSA